MSHGVDDRNLQNVLSPKKAAVLVIVHPGTSGESNDVLFIRRSMEGTHPGQIAFPGGGHEMEDACLLSTALRETTEEVGIPSTLLRVVGPLIPQYTHTRHYIVHPFVAFCPELPRCIPDPSEVGEIFSLPVSVLCDEQLRGETHQVFAGETVHSSAPSIIVGDRVIWGLTYRIVLDFVEALTQSSFPELSSFVSPPIRKIP